MSLVTVMFDSDEWQVVPKKATQSMCDAAHIEQKDWETREALRSDSRMGYYYLFRAMLSDAPQPPVVSAEPWAWMNPENDHDVCVQDWGGWIPLYRAPQPSADAKDAEILAVLTWYASAEPIELYTNAEIEEFQRRAKELLAAMQKGGA